MLGQKKIHMGQLLKRNGLIKLRSQDFTHGLRTSNEGINQRNLKIWTNVADKIYFGSMYLKIWEW